ncbi:UNVERIFIED_CONTAM: hypothetical protein N8J90_07285 [Halobacillus marinus]
MKKLGETKAERLDAAWERAEGKPEDVAAVVQDAYGIDLKYVSETGAGKQRSAYKEETMAFLCEHSEYEKEELEELPKMEVLAIYIHAFDRKLTGGEVRRAVNTIFGINLDGISKLEGTGLAIFSKEQWITRSEDDVFVLHTGQTDADVWVTPTDYFTEQTGETEIPQALKYTLATLGFVYEEAVDTYYYRNPDGASIPDDRKTEMLGAIVGVIQSEYKHLLKES